MRVIITGGSGLIGRALVTELVPAGYEVVVLSRRPQEAQGILPAGVQVVAWDGRSAQDWTALADGARAIVNLAGANIAAGRWTPQLKQAILQSRLSAGYAVLQAVQQTVRKPQVVIQASATGYYGPCGDETVTEDNPAGDDFLARVCEEWERSSAPVTELGVRHAVIRIGMVLSREGGAFPRLVVPFRLFIGGPIGDGRQWFPWIHIADVASAIRYLIESDGASGAFNLVAPAPVTAREFAHTLGRVMGRPAVLPVPAVMLRLLVGEMAVILLHGQRAVPKRLLDMGFHFRYAQLEDALRALLG
ncbi:MAG: TIGR01777 family oxidoreductase [Anaerolineae bacterium]|nr:TIGR01777 family oxidoreductase [Anaerolineae bacterium]MDW8071861.1 TIGR01777 family oxidoreductase [Anaerolineae bacterium]